MCVRACMRVSVCAARSMFISILRGAEDPRVCAGVCVRACAYGGLSVRVRVGESVYAARSMFILILGGVRMEPAPDLRGCV